MMEYNKIYNESCLDTMQRLADNSVDLVITSPPYDNMRKYGDGKNYHQRLKDTGYSFEFEEIAQELTRTLKEGGVIMWNVQDQTIKGSRTGNSMRQALHFMDLGLLLHDHLIWEKTGTPFPSPYRYRNVWENMFIFSKGKPKTFNPIMVKNKNSGYIRNRRERNHEGVMVDSKKVVQVKEYGIDKNVWLIPNGYTNSKQFKGAETHPAIFPDEMARRHIQSWSNEGDIVYDPFSGSGTTSKIAAEMGRTYLGSEIHKEYYEASIGILNESLKYKQFFE
jgi:site-specific DNA-methyltransferase (adenine-specific)